MSTLIIIRVISKFPYSFPMIFHFTFVSRTDNGPNSTTVPNTFPRITYYEQYCYTDALIGNRRAIRRVVAEKKPAQFTFTVRRKNRAASSKPDLAAARAMKNDLPQS